MRDAVVTVFRDRINLAAVADEWDDLARHAVEVNPAYEPAQLLRALRRQPAGEGVRFVLVWLDGAHGRRQLGALFPFQGPLLHRGLPLVALRSWCQHGTPLVRQGFAHECLHALLDWFAEDGEGAALLELRSLACDGAVYRAFADVARARGQMVLSTRAGVRRRNLLIGDGPWGELGMTGLPLLRWAKRSVASLVRRRYTAT
jgi:hypothetical protein